VAGDGLRELRRRKLLSQIELAKALETNYQTVQRWEAGEREPRAASKRRLCEVLGVTPEELLAALELSAAEGKAVA
jgi:transcriptional regulator with XRE-family HTH domain